MEGGLPIFSAWPPDSMMPTGAQAMGAHPGQLSCCLFVSLCMVLVTAALTYYFYW